MPTSNERKMLSSNEALKELNTFVIFISPVTYFSNNPAFKTCYFPSHSYVKKYLLVMCKKLDNHINHLSQRFSKCMIKHDLGNIHSFFFGSFFKSLLKISSNFIADHNYLHPVYGRPYLFGDVAIVLSS